MIAGEDSDSNSVTIQVYAEDEYYTGFGKKFSTALRLGKKLAAYDSMDDLIEYLDEETDLKVSYY